MIDSASVEYVIEFQLSFPLKKTILGNVIHDFGLTSNNWSRQLACSQQPIKLRNDIRQAATRKLDLTEERDRMLEMASAPMLPEHLHLQPSPAG